MKHRVSKILNDSELWKTIFAVVIIAVVTVLGAGIYDRYSGGPEAREASVESRRVLAGQAVQQARSECVTTYSVADSAATAGLDISIGVIVESAASDSITREQIQDVHDATRRRIRYLILRAQTNEKCDPDRKGGMEPLPDEVINRLVDQAIPEETS